MQVIAIMLKAISGIAAASRLMTRQGGHQPTEATNSNHHVNGHEPSLAMTDRVRDSGSWLEPIHMP